MARVVSQALDHLGNFYILKDDGILEKKSPVLAPLWSVQTKLEPTVGNFVYANHFSLDIDSNVWLTYSDILNIVVRSGAAGTVITEVLGTACNTLCAQTGGLRMFALSTSRGVFYELNTATKAIVRSFDLTVQIPNFQKGYFVAQIDASLAGKIWFPALVGPLEGPQASALVAFDPAGNGSFACHQIPTMNDIPLITVGADVAGKIYAANVHGDVFRFNESILVNTFDSFYSPVAPGGVIDIITFTNSDQPVLVDDGTFAFAGGKTRTMNPANGDLVSTISSTNVGTVTGDILGYHHVKLTRINVVPTPIVPVVDSNKLNVFVKSDGSITFTGRPGFVVDALSVECYLDAGPTLVGTVVPNADGSFSVTSLPGVAVIIGEPVTVKSIRGLQFVNTLAMSAPRGIPAAFDTVFLISGLILAGAVTRLKAKIYNFVGGPVTVPAAGVLPIFRLKRDADSKWFSGQSFVPDNGDYLQPSFDVDGQFWYADVTIPAEQTGSLSLVIKDSPPYVSNLILIPPPASAEDLAAVQASLDELNAKVDIAFGAPANAFTDPTTIGGFIFEKLVDIQKTAHRTLRGIIGTRNVVVESILVDVSRQSCPKGSTPAIDITIYDEERRFPLDISGCAVSMKAKVNLGSSVLVIDQDAEIISGPDGQARVRLTATETSIARRLSAQIVVQQPGTGTLVSPPFIFDIEESVL
jgi:hypothetical protein